jgi:hypothetical protein
MDDFEGCAPLLVAGGRCDLLRDEYCTSSAASASSILLGNVGLRRAGKGGKVGVGVRRTGGGGGRGGGGGGGGGTDRVGGGVVRCRFTGRGALLDGLGVLCKALDTVEEGSGGLWVYKVQLLAWFPHQRRRLGFNPTFSRE